MHRGQMILLTLKSVCLVACPILCASETLGSVISNGIILKVKYTEATLCLLLAVCINPR